MNLLRVGAILGFLGVAFGAFGAHELKRHLSPLSMMVWDTAVFYHLIHAVVILGLGLYAKASGVILKFSGSFFLAGIILFSGSLYALAITGIRPLGAITPLGGVCFLIGWGCLAIKRS